MPMEIGIVGEVLRTIRELVCYTLSASVPFSNQGQQVCMSLVCLQPPFLNATRFFLSTASK